MKVSELIQFLKDQPQDMEVGYCCFSEQCILEEDDIKVELLSVERSDGWIHDKRPDKPTKEYLIFPGN